MLTRVLDALAHAHVRKKQTREQIVVITHSMGGQLFFDAINYYAALDARLAGIEIDHWITCGSQVSFFAELGLFKAQPSATAAPNKLPRPAAVLRWTNYYDTNDVLGFVMEPVFDGVRDEPYDTGYGLAYAHSGFLARASFFETVAKSL
jgi:pimeloyl-ACP methyl ester carboxylesterase